ncbi:ferrochelatase [Streptomyces malaysiensis subsp. malaysiensis]|uniref:Coproporphyrin III ferrochelatase n=1 Tax=Streptomyces malaysiensis TaxID=92644 RepID=A0ABX6WEG3_STRMQ|nr:MULTISPECIES: ferrochelatase [Streptomyces]MCC4318487.1 ferrochelatase [Streptomyces malaysiensis]AUA10753.1 Ferrochelatase [Streptomyces sp. M56]MYX58520.1 ferrochelatase [Streptomyces sp. SID8382]QPI58999.1 ferrochelatase [Streptomyces solisilvae]UHH20636.1 ferrochelatase [Streptomyces sp. HNM0561]
MPDQSVQPSPDPYDALLLLSFGGPEGPEDVVPFLENVTHGRGIPRERLKEVGRHYFLFGGVSPINAQNRELLHALRKDFSEHGLELPVYWGNRNWAPYLTDTLRELVTDGHRRVLVLATSAYASYSGCRQYRENLADALAALEGEGLPLPRVDKLRHYFNHPGFVRPMVDATLAALAELPEERRAGAHLAFTTHSIPITAADTSGPVAAHTEDGEGGAYVAQHLDVARLIADAVREETGVERPWRLVYQSRSGAPHIPWLEPDICDHLEELHGEGVPAAVMVPIGFVSDHMEVKYDLDTEATAKAAELGLPVSRASTVGADPRFAAGVRDLVLERAATERFAEGRAAAAPERCALGALGPSHDVCPVGCCPARSPRPAAAGSD